MPREKKPRQRPELESRNQSQHRQLPEATHDQNYWCCLIRLPTDRRSFPAKWCTLERIKFFDMILWYFLIIIENTSWQVTSCPQRRCHRRKGFASIYEASSIRMMKYENSWLLRRKCLRSVLWVFARTTESSISTDWILVEEVAIKWFKQTCKVLTGWPVSPSTKTTQTSKEEKIDFKTRGDPSRSNLVIDGTWILARRGEWN